MSCEVRMYCDGCGSNMLIDQHGTGSFRDAVSIAIDNAVRAGFRRTPKGWLCPGCLVGMPNAFDIDQHDQTKRNEAKRRYKEKFPSRGGPQ